MVGPRPIGGSLRIVSAPRRMTKATQPFTDLIRGEIEAATEAGALLSTDPGRDTWLTTQLILSVSSSTRSPARPIPIWRTTCGASASAPSAARDPRHQRQAVFPFIAVEDGEDELGGSERVLEC